VRIELGKSGNAQRRSAPTKANEPSSTQLLSINSKDGIHRARLVDRTMRSLDTSKLRAEIVGLHKPGHPPMVMFSMRGMESLASGCLGAFAELSTDLERVGGILVLYNLPKEIAKVLRKTKLDRVIHTAKARPQAHKRVLAAKKKHAEALLNHAA
tara:strand:+ start:492 stop:956 length:465 start_codon:yes stop_codon:yes gene_type:complete